MYNHRSPLIRTVGVVLSSAVLVQIGLVAWGRHHAPAPASQVAVAAGPVLPARDTKSATRLGPAMTRIGYKLNAVADGAEVPRLLLHSMPSNMADVTNLSRRKAVFLRVMLPLVLKVDEAVAAKRARLKDIASAIRTGEPLSNEDMGWLGTLAENYNVPWNGTANMQVVRRLLYRVDVVPPSLALAQAAMETGWGTSLRARVYHNVFGLTFAADNGKEAVLASFPNLLAAVRFYVHTLNTHPAYAAFRRIRAEARARGGHLNGERLALALEAYSEIGRTYVHDIRTLIRQNDLTRFEHAQLSKPDDETAGGQI